MSAGSLVRDSLREIAKRKLVELRSERVSALEKENAKLRAQNATLEKERNHYQAECLGHLRRIAEIEGRTNE